MKSLWWWNVIMVNACLLSSWDWARSDDGPTQAAFRCALLVGVEKYPLFGANEQLEGCINDTTLMHRTLTERYGFAEQDIVILTNEAATSAKIREELANLVSRIQSLPAGSPPAQVVFHFSGHGSQVPDQPEGDADSDELDGLDETLVPSDATKQGGVEDLRDDELQAFAELLCQGNRASLWIVLDCCHSGTGARGVSKFRSLERGSALPVVADQQESRRVTPKRLPEQVIVLSACRSSEKEPEFQDETGHYGLLTRFLTQTLNQEQAVSRLSYEALRESLIIQYRQAGVSQAPTPQLEGNGRSVVLGAGRLLDRPAIWKVVPFQRDRTRALVKAGALHGLTCGSLYEVYDRPYAIIGVVDNSNGLGTSQSAAWLQIEKVEGVSATARVFRWDGDQQISATLPAGMEEGFAVERHHEHGSFVLAVRVVKAVDDFQDGPAITAEDQQLPTCIQNVLRAGSSGSGIGSSGESPWIRWSTDREPSDVVLRIAGDHAALFPSSGKAATIAEQHLMDSITPTSLRGGWGPIDLRDAEAEARLKSMLRQVNRARNLLRVAALSLPAGGGGPDVALELREVDLDEEFNITDHKSWPVSTDENGHSLLAMKDGAYYAFQITNREPAATGKPAYVTVLHIDANMGIDVILPYQQGSSEEQLILPGESRMSDPFQCNGDPDEPPVHGMRHAIVLATREANDFYTLTSPSLPVSRGTVSPANRPLNDLLTEQTYFRTRGGSTRLRPEKPSETSWSAATIQWIVHP